MKIFKFVLSACLLTFLTFNTTSAQVDDTLPPWFRGPIPKLEPGIIDWNSTYVLLKSRQVISAQKSLTVAKKAVALPSKMKVLKGPITIKRGQNCYEIYCQQGPECKDCQLTWWDRNGDGKIQPRRELRCVCTKTGDKCAIKARRVKC